MQIYLVNNISFKPHTFALHRHTRPHTHTHTYIHQHTHTHTHTNSDTHKTVLSHKVPCCALIPLTPLQSEKTFLTQLQWRGVDLSPTSMPVENYADLTNFFKILRDMIMDDELMYVLNDDKLFLQLKLLVEKFEHG